MMKITGLSHLFKWENLHNWWLTKYFFSPLYMLYIYPCIRAFTLHAVAVQLSFPHRVYFCCAACTELK